MKLTPKEIKEIADHLETGMICYFSRKTREIKAVLNFDDMPYADDELWQDLIQEIEENLADYDAYEGMSSRDSFNIMVDFIGNVDNTDLKASLITAINKRKPFANFKWQIDNSGEYRQKWFDYRKKRYLEWVKEQAEAHNRKENRE
jgi:hypothetical protein